jgi:hypothetical protein
MADSALSNDYKLDDLTVTVKDAADDLGKLAVEKTTFSQLKSGQIFSQAPALAGSDALAIGDTKLAVSAWLRYTAQEETQLEPIDLAGLGRPIAGIAVTFEMFGLRTLWRPDSATRNPSKIFDATRQAFAALAQSGGYRSQIEGLIRQLDSVVSGDPFSTRLLGAALVRYLTESGQSKLLTSSASYKAGASTTIAAAGGSS